jgi:hypothetical protein
MAEAGGLEKQSCLTSAMIRTALWANRVLAGIARSVAGAELTARAGGFLSNEHGPARVENVAAIRGVDYTMSRTRGQGA